MRTPAHHVVKTSTVLHLHLRILFDLHNLGVASAMPTVKLFNMESCVSGPRLFTIEKTYLKAKPLILLLSLIRGHPESSDALLKAEGSHQDANDDHISADPVTPLAFLAFPTAVRQENKQRRFALDPRS